MPTWIPFKNQQILKIVDFYKTTFVQLKLAKTCQFSYGCMETPSFQEIDFPAFTNIADTFNKNNQRHRTWEGFSYQAPNKHQLVLIMKKYKE